MFGRTSCSDVRAKHALRGRRNCDSRRGSSFKLDAFTVTASHVAKTGRLVNHTAGLCFRSRSVERRSARWRIDKSDAEIARMREQASAVARIVIRTFFGLSGGAVVGWRCRSASGRRRRIH